MINEVIDNYSDEFKKSGLFSCDEAKLYCSREVFLKHDFYIELARNFSSLYPSVDYITLKEITIVGYYFFRSLLAFDSIVDERLVLNLKLGLFNYEVAIKKLQSLYEKEDNFWSSFESMKIQYFKGMEVEKSLSTEFFLADFSLFEYIAKNKSIFILLIPKMLSHSSGNFSYMNKLEESLLHLHVGLQILDDMHDFRSDIERKQVTYASASTRAYLENIGIEYKPTDSDLLYKYFFASGVAYENLNLAENQFKLSLKRVEDLPIPNYQRYIVENGIDQVKRTRRLIEDILDQARNRRKNSPANAGT